MNKSKTSSSLRLIAFFLVAIVLICTFGFTADGWQLSDNNTNVPQKGDGINKVPNQDTSEPENEETTENENTPKFYNRLTGEETTEALYNTRHTAFVISPNTPMYGISSADLLIEFPTENDLTRLLAFVISTNSIVKIGSLSKTRGYISNLSAAFDSNIFASGSDDAITYTKCKIDDTFTNEATVSDYVYTEFARFCYTDSTLLNIAFNAKENTTFNSDKDLPFNFNSSDIPIKGDTYFNKITIPYSSTSATTLTFDRENGVYVFEKSNAETTDFLNSEKLCFKNCFVLFADSIIYESQNSTQMVLNTIGCGIGYYFTEGTAKQISWSLSEEGDMKLYDENSAELIINSGKSYISFVKSSKLGDIVLS